MHTWALPSNVGVRATWLGLALVAAGGCGETVARTGTRQAAGAGSGGASGSPIRGGGSAGEPAAGLAGNAGKSTAGGMAGGLANGGAAGALAASGAAGALAASGAGGTAGTTACGPPAKAGAALTGTNTAFCVDGWCPISPQPTPESFVDALLFDGDAWVAATERQVIIRRPGGVARLGDPLPVTIRALAGVAATDLYAAAEGAAGVLFHFDGVSWSAVPAKPTAYSPVRALALSPSGSVFLLSGSGRVTRFDGCGTATITDGLDGDWTSIIGFAVIDDDRMVGISAYGNLVRWSAGVTTKVPVGWKPTGNPSVEPASRLVASSFDDVHVATPGGLCRVVGQSSTLVAPGNGLDVSTDPATPGRFAALVETYENNGYVDKLLSFSGPDAPPVVETLPASGPVRSPTSVRLRGDRRLSFARWGAHAFWESSVGEWSSLYTQLPPVFAGWSWSARASLGGPSSGDLHVTWSNGIFRLAGSALTPLPAPPAANWGQTELLGGGGPLFALGRESLAFASLVAGTWSSLPAPPIPGSTSQGLRASFASPTDIFVAHAQIHEPGIRYEPPFAPAESRTVVHFDGGSWTSVPPAAGCSVRAIAAIGGGKALAATQSCGVLRFEQGTWTSVVGLETVELREIVANAEGVCLGKDVSATVYRITGSAVETFVVPEVFSGLQARGSDFFGVTHESGLGSIHAIARFSAGSWETVATGSPLFAGSAWSRLHVTDDAFFLATPMGDLVRHAR